MKKSQLIGLWVIGILWALTLLIWYSSDSYSWGFVQFSQATIFWGIFCFLSYVTLGHDWSKKKDRRSGVEAGAPTSNVSAQNNGANKLENAMSSKEEEIRILENNSPELFKSENYQPVEYYSVSLKKLTIFSLCTFGLYHIYWNYKNWKAIQVQTGIKITPWARGWFYIFFAYSLFKRVLNSAVRNGFKIEHSAGKLATLFILLMVLWKLPNPYWLISILDFVPLLYIQKAINFNNSVLNSSAKPDDKFSGKDLLIIIVGGLLVLLGIWITVMPEDKSSSNTPTPTISSLGSHYFLNEQFHFSISTPDNWVIVQKKDFGKIDNGLEVVESDIGLIDLQGNYFCAVGSEDLNGYGDGEGMEQLRNNFLARIVEDKTVAIDSNEKIYLNGYDGFEIYYRSIDPGLKAKYMTLYINYGTIGINLTAWTSDGNPTKMFNEIKQIAENIKLVEN